MGMYRKKPIVIEARQLPRWTVTTNAVEYVDEVIALAEWCGGVSRMMDGDPDRIDVPTLEGTLMARPGDWIIKGVQGEFYPCKPDIFESTYEDA